MCLLRLLPICQIPHLTDYSFILKSCCLAGICYKFYDVMSGLVLEKRASSRLVNELTLSLRFLVAEFLSVIPIFFFFGITSFKLPCFLHVAGASSQVKVDLFVALYRATLVFVNRFFYIVGQASSATTVVGPSNKLFVEQIFLCQVVHVGFFFICQAVQFYVFCS